MQSPQQIQRKLWRLFGLAIALSSLASAGVGLMKRHIIARRQIEKLERVSSSIAGLDGASSKPLATRELVTIARLDRAGATMFRTEPVRVAGGGRDRMLDAADAQLPHWPAREEVRAAVAGNRRFGRYWAANGEVLVQTLAQPVPEGGAVYILTGSYISAIYHPAVMALMSLIFGIGFLALGLLVAKIDRWRTRRGLLPIDDGP
jgi:hypothetical protein